MRSAANALVAGTLLTVPLSITTASPNTSGLPLFQFVDSGSGALPWNAVSFETSIDGASMLGGPHAASENGENALAFRASNSDVALFVQSVSGATQYSDLSSEVSTPPAASDPVPFFDPTGAVDVLYVSSTGHLILLSANYNVTARRHVAARIVAPSPYTSTDLTALSGVTAASGLASVNVSGESGVVVVRNASSDVEAISLGWRSNRSVPAIVGAAVNVSNLTNAGTSLSDPVALNTSFPSFVAVSSTGALDLFTTTSSSPNAWTVQNLSLATLAPELTGPVAVQTTGSNVYIAALNTSGDVELFSASLSTVGANARTARASPTTTTTFSTSPWSLLNVTNATANAPPLAGQISLDVTGTQIAIAGQAANWGDLFVLTSTVPSSTWSATNVSVTATNAARPIGPVVAGVNEGTELVLFAAGVNSPPPEGVGVYAIPSKDWSAAITSGWPILSGTGGLGTQASPWVGYTSATSVATSPDFLLGQSIYNSHKRVTWLSFWTVSGPLAGEAQTTTNYYNHGFAAGAWVATQIDQYRGLGVGLRPDWVIFDPEGYPNNSSGLVAPPGASQATMAIYATYWTAMLQGWAQGITSVDPSLNAGLYANQSEYRNYNLAAQPLPIFEAVAFSGNGPTSITGASGSNIRGYIAFSAVCNPTSTLATEISTLKNPPWSGQFNTLQFSSSTYCPPAPT
jgi:hypothetical protein